MAADDGLLPVVPRRIDVRAFPEENIFVREFKISGDGVFRAESGVHEEEFRRFERELGCSNESSVVAGDVDPPIDPVAVQRFPSAVRLPIRRNAPVHVLEKEDFVIAAQEGAADGIGQIDETVDYASRIGTSIDVVTDEHKVIFGPGVQPVKEIIEGSSASVDVSDTD
jgi:hypothetical protein